VLAAAGSALAACGGGSGSKSSGDSKETTLWYWSGGLSDKVVADAVPQFKAQTTVKSSVIGGDFKTEADDHPRRRQVRTGHHRDQG